MTLALPLLEPHHVGMYFDDDECCVCGSSDLCPWTEASMDDTEYVTCLDSELVMRIKKDEHGSRITKVFKFFEPNAGELNSRPDDLPIDPLKVPLPDAPTDVDWDELDPCFYPDNCIVLRRVQTTEERKMMSYIITKFHSYVPTVKTVGRAINYLVYWKGYPIGVIGGGSPPSPLTKCIQDYFVPYVGSWEASHALKKRVTPSLANNWRFCMTPDSPHNGGTKVLSIFTARLKKDWEMRYGVPLRWILTYVADDHEGSVYKGSNWKFLGMTKGFHRKGCCYRNDPLSRQTARPRENVKTTPKKIFIKDVYYRNELLKPLVAPLVTLAPLPS
jgi:hypothetical protein